MERFGEQIGLQREPKVLLEHAPPAGTPTGEDWSVEDGAIARIVARLSSEYVLRAFQLLIDSFGDVRAGLLAQAIHTANVAYLDARTERGRRAAGSDGIIPDELRRPISIARLADSAGLPFESTRRIVQRLSDMGACVRVDAGVIVPKAAVERPETVRAVIANAGYVRRFVRDLQAAGLAEADPLAGPQAAERTDVDGPAVRIVARLSAEYILRALGLLVDSYGDIRAGIVAQTVVTANTAHLDARTGAGRRYAGIDHAPPDEVRKPISIARLAASLGVPYETMRGQVRRLLDSGVCIRVDGGVIVPTAVLERPEMARVMLANVRYVRRLVRDLCAVEFDSGSRRGPSDAPTPELGL